MSDIPRYVVIPHYNRPGVALGCIDSMKGQSDTIFVVENSDKDPLPDVSDLETLTPYYLIPHDEHPVNLSRAWNAGIQACDDDAKRMGAVEWDIAILNDDALVHSGWYDAVATAMRRKGAAAACSGGHFLTQLKPGPVPLSMRMQGWAFVLRGEVGLRADEQFQWWYGDSDLDWQAREAGGMTMVQGYEVVNRFADLSTNGIRAQQAAEDGQRFVKKWGMRAW